MMSLVDEGANVLEIPESQSDLNFLVREMEVELEQKEEMLQTAVSYGKKLEEEVRKLEERLSFWMQSAQNTAALEEQCRILEESLRESKLNEQEAKEALWELTRDKDIVEKELNHRKEHDNLVENEYIDILENVQHRDDRRRTKIEKLQADVVREEINLARAQDAFQKITFQHRESQSRLREITAENRTLKKDLQAKERMFGEVVLGLSAEKARLEQDYTHLATEFDKLEAEVKAPKMRSASTQRDVLPIDVFPLSEEIEQLTDEREEITEESSETYELKVDFELSRSRRSRETVVIPDVLREYLHITASAVKLHFPDVLDVKSEQLISIVKHLPFHKYYEHMTEYMNNLKPKKNVDVLVKEVTKQPPKNERRFWWFSGRKGQR